MHIKANRLQEEAKSNVQFIEKLCVEIDFTDDRMQLQQESKEQAYEVQEELDDGSGDDSVQGVEGTEKGVEGIGEEIEDSEGVLYGGHEGVEDGGEEPKEGGEEGEDDEEEVGTRW
mgnify:CR=1 FL=1